MAAQYAVRITDGPDREQLLDAFKYAHHSRTFEVKFSGDVWQGDTVSGTISFLATIAGLTHEDDGSGYSFIVTAYTTAPTHKGKRVEYYYNAKDRTGHVEL